MPDGTPGEDAVEEVVDTASLAADEASRAAVDAAEADSTDEKVEARDEAVDAATTAERAAAEARRAGDSDAQVVAEDEAQRAAASAARAQTEVDPDDPLLDTVVREIEAGVTEEKPFGEPGKPLATRSPFRIAFVATLGVLAAYALARAVVTVRNVLILLLVSGFLAIGLNPVVEWLQRRGLRRGRAVLAVFTALLVFFGGFAAAVVPPIAKQGTEFFQELPEYADRLQRENKTFRRLDQRYQIVEKVRANTADAPGLAARALGGVGRLAKGVFGAIFGLVTVLILTAYFLASYPAIKRNAYRLVPRSRRARVGLLTDEILQRVGGYVLGNIATSVVAGVAAAIFLAAFGVPYAVALALFVAIVDLIPLVGATIGAVVCVAVAFFAGVTPAVASIIFFTIYQQFENYVLVPRVMKRTVNVSPAVTIVAVLIGGTLLGIVGALLAIPIAAAIQLVGSEVLYPRQDSA